MCSVSAHCSGSIAWACGREWIRVGNDYLLVSVVSGIIFGAIAAH
ncbi:RcnB family protein [Mesorhizobium sp.]|nr:RcnB family protein [Mesorhizobium sp.]